MMSGCWGSFPSSTMNGPMEGTELWGGRALGAATGIAQAHQVSEQEKEDDKQQKQIVRRHRYLSVHTPESAQEEIEDQNRYHEAHCPRAKHVPRLWGTIFICGRISRCPSASKMSPM